MYLLYIYMESVIEKFSKKPKIATKKSFTVALEIEKNNNREKNDELIEIDVLTYQEEKEQKEKEEKEKPIIIDQTKEATKEDKNEYKKMRKKLTKHSKVSKKEEEEPVVEQEQIQNMDKEIKIKAKRRKRKTKPVDISRQAVNEITSVELGDEIKERLPSKDKFIVMKHSSYYMNNREKFIYFINNLFRTYKDELLKEEHQLSCDGSKQDSEFKLLIHQKIVRDYINFYTPYRGLLIYHGLGSGKTCSSIAIAEGFLGIPAIAFTEGLTSMKKIVVMTPASLKTNFFEELKKCGNPIFKKQQYWDFVSVNSNDEEKIAKLSKALGLKVSYIKEQKGAWLVNVKKETNYHKLSTEHKNAIEKQIDEMIRQKYTFISYNGLRFDKLNEITKQNTFNPFDNKVIIIDEAHNFVSRIVNKIEKDNAKSPKFISTKLYELLLTANNARIILLTGTPIINYPNEIGILFNLLRGYIKSWSMPIKINPENPKKITTEMIQNILKKHEIVDYIEIINNNLIITRNPYSFSNKFYSRGENVNYLGVKKNIKMKTLSDEEFSNNIVDLLTKNGITIHKPGIKIEYNKALPDKLNDFMRYFINEDTGDFKNEDVFKKRILGLTSYFKSAQEQLMPSYKQESDLHIINIEMSDYQFSKYEEVRLQERNIEKKRKSKKANDLYSSTNSSYRIFSRCYCNFVFPNPPGRPMPKKKIAQEVKDGDDKFNLEEAIELVRDEDDVDGITDSEKKKNIDGRYLEDENIVESNIDDSYGARIQNALNFLVQNKDTLLTHEALQTYSPKFLHILENLEDPMLIGSHLIYSQFRTLEGIGILSIIMEASGFVKFKLKKEGINWSLDIPKHQRIPKKMFALYTGTETTEEKELIRNIFNGNFDLLPSKLKTECLEINKNNFYGEIIKVFMITASGAEGISLKNVRHVHIVEPYWHPVRKEQVIGRARRICSHSDLPEAERNIKVYMYLMKFTDNQIQYKMSKTIKNNDKSKYDKTNKRPFTSDESLFEIMNRKENITNQLLRSIKEASFDCSIHNSSSSEETLECFSFGNETNSKFFSYKPNLENEDKDEKVKELNILVKSWRAKKKIVNGKAYALRLDDNREPTDKLYDLVSFQRAQANPGKKIQAEYVGKLIKGEDGKEFIEGS